MDRSPEHLVEVFFDGDCPLCRREVGMMKRLDRRSNVRFTDIAGPDFRPAELGIDFETLMAEIHGRLPNGEWIRGVEVFRRIYSALGFGWLVSITRWPLVSKLLDKAYVLFARNRLRLTGRCGDACSIEGAP